MTPIAVSCRSDMDVLVIEDHVFLQGTSSRRGPGRRRCSRRTDRVKRSTCSSVILLSMLALVHRRSRSSSVPCCCSSAWTRATDPVAGGRHLYHPFRSHQLNPGFVRAFDSHGVKLHSPDGFRSDVPIPKDKPDGAVPGSDDGGLDAVRHRCCSRPIRARLR